MHIDAAPSCTMAANPPPNTPLPTNPPSVEPTVEPTVEILLHLFCTQKSISLKNEKTLFNILSTPIFQRGFLIQSFDAFRKQLDISLRDIEPTIIHCSTKHPGQKNYKPLDPNKLGPTCAIPVYNLRQHLESFLKDEQLSRSVITKHNCDGNTYSDFTSGTYFRDLCLSLPEDVVPLCCK